MNKADVASNFGSDDGITVLKQSQIYEDTGKRERSDICEKDRHGGGKEPEIGTDGERRIGEREEEPSRASEGGNSTTGEHEAGAPVYGEMDKACEGVIDPAGKRVTRENEQSGKL